MTAPMLILFDIDGTLLVSGGAGRIGLARAFEEVFGVSDMDAISRRIEYNGRTDPLILADLAVGAGIEEAEFTDRIGALEESYLRHLGLELARTDSPARLLPGVESLIRELSRHPAVYLALLTGNSEAGARAKLQPFGLNAAFATGGFGSDHADRRTLAAIARRRSEERFQQRFLPDRVVVVGDTEHDIDCAHHNGFRCIAVLTGGRNRDQLAQHRPSAILEGLDRMDSVFESLALDALDL